VVDHTNAERQRRYIARLKAAAAGQASVSNGGGSADVARYESEIAALKAEIAALMQELAAAKAKPAPRSDDSAEIARLKKELYECEMGERVTRHQLFKAKQEIARLARPPRPPLPPDEARDREIKALKTRMQNLKGEVHHLREYVKKGSGNMPFATMAALAKVLHPDHTPSEAQRGEACRLFTAWKADNGKARRQSR
jgi:hypothetical protein